MKKILVITIVKEFIYKTIQAIKISIKNIKEDIDIKSVQASCQAKYSPKSSIGRHTVVARDVEIGYASYVNEWSWIENCKIGNYCSISDHVMIGPTEHCINKMLSHPVGVFLGGGNKHKEKIIIGNDVLVSHGVTILNGVTIGDGAVIAAGAVVTKDVLPYSIVGGVPAKLIRMRFDEKTIREIKSIDLYNMSIEDVRKLNC